MKCNQTKCQWNISCGCMKPAWMECPLTNIKFEEEALIDKAERILSVAKAIQSGKGKKDKRRVNPHRIPVSKASVKKLQGAITSDAINLAMALFLTTLCDKFGYDSDSLQDVWKEVNALSDGVVKGYVNVNDLLRVLDEEYGITIKV